MRKNNKVITIIMAIIIVILAVLCVLLGTNKISFVAKNNNYGISDTKDNKTNKTNNHQVSNNISIVCGEPEGNCTNNKQKINTAAGEKTLDIVSNQEIKLDDTTIYKVAEGENLTSMQQLNVYNDIIVLFEGASLGANMYIYNIEGKKIKTITRFIDNNGNLFTIYPKYSEHEIFNIAKDGTISFVGTKHVQGVGGTYITNSGDEINLCSGSHSENNTEYTDEYKDDDIVSGIFKMNYLGNYKFSDISYVSTKTTINDIRNCSW